VHTDVRSTARRLSHRSEPFMYVLLGLQCTAQTIMSLEYFSDDPYFFPFAYVLILSENQKS
jgi:hypothetical protein